ncbi:MAG: metal-sulfur cluster assembly factor [Sedimenticola sp.]|nr:metal-sulfur cluster assembly factor [Sedimenticola sp.]
MKEKLSDEEVALKVVYAALETVIDPEVGINIVDLGLVYDVAASAERVTVSMTLTSPACPMGSLLADESREAIQAKVPPSVAVEVKLVWEPPWSPEKMSDKAKKQLGWA